MWTLFKSSAIGWYRRNPFQQGAALAFYGAFALAPTLFLAIAVAGLIYGEDAAEGQLAKTLSATLGPTVAQAIGDSLAYVHVTRTGFSATLVGAGLLIFAVTSMFLQLQTSLNAIWGAAPVPAIGIWSMIRNRIAAFLIVLGIGLLLLVLMIANAMLVTMRQFAPEAAWTRDSNVWETLKWCMLLALHTLWFAMIYKLLPDAIISWRDTMVGALLTAILLLAGNYLIGYYLGSIAPAFGYWAASSLIVVMLWVYYSSMVLLFGAELTKNLSMPTRQPVRPPGNAIYQ